MAVGSGTTVHFLTFGVGFTAIGLSLLWVAPSPRVVYLLLAIGGIGIASFHPQATTYAGALAGGGRGMGTSIFLTGGNIGRALGPLVLMFIPYRLGLEYLVWEMIPGVLLAVLVPESVEIREVAGSHRYSPRKVERRTKTARTLLDCRPSHTFYRSVCYLLLQRSEPSQQSGWKTFYQSIWMTKIIRTRCVRL